MIRLIIKLFRRKVLADNINNKKLNYAVCASTGLTFHEMAESVFDAFIASYYDNGTFRNADFWDNAEIFEAVADAYEQTGEEKYLKYIKEISSATILKNGESWQSNIYNDDIMWLVIAYTRSYLLTGNPEYLSYAKLNLDAAYNRAYSGDLGGGLW
jgi:rhamnogalacturonyl hydrolase YesR